MPGQSRRIPMDDMTFLISYVALWALVGLLVVAVFLLYRHFGRELLRKQEAYDQLGPAIDSPISLNATSIDGMPYTIGIEHTRPHIVFFASARCEHCERIRPALREAAVAAGREIGIVVVFRGSPENARSYVERMPTHVVAIADPRREIMNRWRVISTPYVVIVDSEGIARKKVMSTTRSDLESALKMASDLRSTAMAAG